MKDEASSSIGGAQKLKRWLRPLMLIVTALFVVWTAFDLKGRWHGPKVSIHYGWLFLSLLPVLVGAVLQGLGWILLVERMAKKATPRLAALSLYFVSQLARYTPGKVGLPLIRMEGAPRLGLGRRLVGLSVLIEMLSWTATGAVVGFTLLWGAGSPSEGIGAIAGRFAPVLLGFSLVLMVALVAVDRRRLPVKLRTTLAIEGEGPLAPLRLPLLQLLYWATWAVHGYLLALSLGASSAAALSTTGFSPLANVLGFVALAAPAGVGVREAVLVAGLGPVLGGPSAVSAAIASRVVSLVADVSSWLFVRARGRTNVLQGSDRRN